MGVGKPIANCLRIITLPLAPYSSRLHSGLLSRFIQRLDHIAVRIGKIERITAVPVLCGWLGDGGAILSRVRCTSRNSSSTCAGLRRITPKWSSNCPRGGWYSASSSGAYLVQGQIVASRTKIDIVRIRLPDHLHRQEPFVESARPSKIRHAKGQMS